MREFIRRYQDIFYFKIVENHLSGLKSVLDVGCGADSPLKRVKKTFRSEGVDIFKKSIQESKKKKIHDSYKICDIRNLVRVYKRQSFDVVIALDVIEHLEKEEALRVIKDMEKIACNKVILLTPNGFYHQDAYDSNPYQIHKSSWGIDDLKNLGYKVYGLRGLKYLRGEYATIRYRPWFLWGLVAFLSEPLLYFFPKLSYHLFAVKDV